MHDNVGGQTKTVRDDSTTLPYTWHTDRYSLIPGAQLAECRRCSAPTIDLYGNDLSLDRYWSYEARFDIVYCSIYIMNRWQYD